MDNVNRIGSKEIIHHEKAVELKVRFVDGYGCVSSESVVILDEQIDDMVEMLLSRKSKYTGSGI